MEKLILEVDSGKSIVHGKLYSYSAPGRGEDVYSLTLNISSNS